MAKLSSYGSKLKAGTTSGDTAIAQVMDISGPALSGDRVDVTTHDSTSAFRDYVPTLLDGGEITFDLVYDPGDVTQGTTGGQGSLLSDYANQREISYTLVPAGSTANTWTFNGHVTGFEPEAPVEGHHRASVTVAVTGKVTTP